MTNCNEILDLARQLRDKQAYFSEQFSSIDKRRPADLLVLAEEINNKLEEYLKEHSCEKAFIEALHNDFLWEDLRVRVGVSAKNSVGGDYFQGEVFNVLNDNLFVFLGERNFWGKPLLKLTSKRYKRFVGEFCNDEYIRGQIEDVINVIPGEYRHSNSRSMGYACYSAFNSCFLRYFLKKGAEIEVDGLLPPELNDYFGAFLAHGTIRAKKLGDHAGANLAGGRIIANEVGMFAGEKMIRGLLQVDVADNMLGDQMVGGKIIANKAGAQTGKKMKGGEIVVEEAGASLGFLMGGGKITCEKTVDDYGGHMSGGALMIGKGGYNGGQYAKGGTICVRDAGYRLGNGAANCTIVFEKSGDLLGSNLLGTEAVFLGINHINTDDVVIGGDLGKIYGLTGGHFQTPTGRKVKLIDNRETLTDFHQSGIGVFLVRLNTGQALLPMENKINQGDLTDGMKGGILIIEGLPDRIIGVGMKGGAVIFKNFGGDVDALKKLIFLRKSSGLLSGDG